jgi:regulator of protease activity HflC (stomatin/prohibitin superfamily)
MMNSYFLSPTNTFDFEIAEATANTTEELNVTFDWRIGFQFAEGSRLGFYNQYGAKDIRAISSDIVMPLLLESIKTVIYRYSFKDLSAKSDEIKAATYELAQQKLAEKGISLQYMNIIDIRLPQSYLASQEELLKAENERKLAEAALETQKKQAEKELLKAENDKQMKIVEAEAIAEYNRIVSEQNLTAQGIEMKKLEIEAKKIEKWDGKLPASVEGGLTF